MAANVSSNDSLPHPNGSSGVSSHFLCFLSAPSSFIYFSFYATIILVLLPLCIFILYLGVQQWRQQCSASSAAAAMSHSDAFTYHMVTMELVCVLASALCCYGICNNDPDMVMVGLYLSSFTWYGETSFNMLTCAERYLAVLHPVTYRGLRSQRGIRIRNVTIGGVWLLSVVQTILMIFNKVTALMEIGLLFSSLVVISFCSLSVLCALIRPGPGHQGGNRDRVDQSKRRAFYTITVILAVLSARCSWNIAWDILILSDADCLLTSCPVWFNLPSSLVLPLLFLHKSGRLTCHKSSANKAGDQI